MGKRHINQECVSGFAPPVGRQLRNAYIWTHEINCGAKIHHARLEPHLFQHRASQIASVILHNTDSTCSSDNILQIMQGGFTFLRQNSMFILLLEEVHSLPDVSFYCFNVSDLNFYLTPALPFFPLVFRPPMFSVSLFSIGSLSR